MSTNNNSVCDILEQGSKPATASATEDQLLKVDSLLASNKNSTGQLYSEDPQSSDKDMRP